MDQISGVDPCSSTHPRLVSRASVTPEESEQRARPLPSRGRALPLHPRLPTRIPNNINQPLFYGCDTIPIFVKMVVPESLGYTLGSPVVGEAVLRTGQYMCQ